MKELIKRGIIGVGLAYAVGFGIGGLAGYVKNIEAKREFRDNQREEFLASLDSIKYVRPDNFVEGNSQFICAQTNTAYAKKIAPRIVDKLERTFAVEFNGLPTFNVDFNGGNFRRDDVKNYAGIYNDHSNNLQILTSSEGQFYNHGNWTIPREVIDSVTSHELWHFFSDKYREDHVEGYEVKKREGLEKFAYQLVQEGAAEVFRTAYDGTFIPKVEIPGEINDPSSLLTNDVYTLGHSLVEPLMSEFRDIGVHYLLENPLEVSDLNNLKAWQEKARVEMRDSYKNQDWEYIDISAYTNDFDLELVEE